MYNLTAACMVTANQYERCVTVTLHFAHKLGNVVWTVPKSGNIITYSSDSRAHKHVITNKKATLQSRDYPAKETPASKSNIQSSVLYNVFICTYYF